MFKHKHPYPPYIPKGTKKLIVGTLPPPRFSLDALKDGDVDFCYGSKDGQLWKIISRVFDFELTTDDPLLAKKQRENLLTKHKIGVCDMVESCFREKIDASDLGIKNPSFRPIIPLLKKNPSVEMLLFTGGNSKNGPEFLFRKYLKDYPEIELKKVSDTVPRIHQFDLDGRTIQTVSLTAPSGAANRAVGGMELYKKMKKENPSFTTVDFRVLQYAPFLKS